MPDPQLGSEARPLRVAIVGSGPSAFYAADALFKAENLSVSVDMFDRLPTPYGLVRGGVAPDHQKIKSVVRVYEKIAANERFSFFGNVKLGRDVQVGDLQAHYDHIVYAVGSESARGLGVPGEDLQGVHSATEFVFWYNGHPDYRECEFDLAGAKRVAIVGNGNVAMDVCRVLIQDPERLQPTDIADHALEALRGSGVREVLLLGRRGPAQAAFSPKEVAEIAAMEEVSMVVRPDDVEVDAATQAWLDGDAPKSAHKNLAFLTKQAAEGDGAQERKVRCLFCESPVEVLGDGNKVTGVKLEHGELHLDDRGVPRPKGTGQFSQEPVDMVFTAIGYRGIPIPGVPFDEGWGTIPNDDGRLTDKRGGAVIASQYVVGWAKRGPTGLIGTNSPDSKATVAKMLEDLKGATAAPVSGDGIATLLRERGIDFVSYEDWLKLDAWELEQGKAKGRVREKLVSIDAMMEVIRAAS